MQVSKGQTGAWKRKLKRGDLLLIEKISGKNTRHISRAIRTGRMNEETFNVIEDFFASK